MDYEVVQNLIGRKIVEYKCGTCSTALQSPLAEAGTAQQCPRCDALIVTPGVVELEQHRREEVVREAADEQARREKEQAQERERQLEERERREQQGARQREREPELVWYGQMACNRCGYRWKARRNTPPARCPGCSGRDVVPIRQARAGCAASIVLFLVLAALLGALACSTVAAVAAVP